MTTLGDFYIFYTLGYQTQLYTPPVLPEGQCFDTLFCDNFKGTDLPVIFRQRKGYGGNKHVDFLNTGYTCFGPVSDRVIELLRDGGFTGWDSYPVEVYLKDGSKLDGYQGLMVTGSCGALNPSIPKPIDVVGYYWKGVSWPFLKGFPLDIASWDGTDIFRPDDLSVIIISRRLRDAFKQAKISNVNLNENATDSLFTLSDDNFVSRLVRDKGDIRHPIAPDCPIRKFSYLRTHGLQTQLTVRPIDATNSSPVLFIQNPDQRGWRLFDTIDTGTDMPILISDKTVKFLESGRFTGWSAQPATVLLNDGSTLHNYNLLSISGRCGKLDLSIPQPVPVEWANPKRKGRSVGFKGFPLDTNSWDGTDIFLAGNPPHVFVTSELRAQMEHAGLSNFFFRNAADCLITDTLPFGDLFPLLNDFHGLSTK